MSSTRCASAQAAGLPQTVMNASPSAGAKVGNKWRGCKGRGVFFCGIFVEQDGVSAVLFYKFTEETRKNDDLRQGMSRRQVEEMEVLR